MNIYELSNIISDLKYKDFSSGKIKNINYNSRENILAIKYDTRFQIEVNLSDDTLQRVWDLGKVENISFKTIDD